MKTRQVNCGFLPLVDCASLVIAKEIGFAAEENIDLILHKEPTWSLIRDKLTFGYLDAAIVLSPMPIAASLRLGGVGQRIDVLSVASVNGNVIGVTGELRDQLKARGADLDFKSPTELGRALAEVVDKPLKFGVPFPFSMHKELVLYWLKATGFDIEKMLDIRTVPPPVMAEAIKNREIDAFCVGEPWGSVTVDRTEAELILPGSAIWAMAPEKVLAARHAWVEENQFEAGALFRATWRAAKWISNPENLMSASEILSRPAYVDVPASVIDRALTGRIVTDAQGTEERAPRFLEFFNAQARFPWRSQAVWIADRLSERHGLDREASRSIARDCFRADLYRKFISPLGEDTPGASEKVEGLFDRATPVGSAKGEITLGPDYFFDKVMFDPDKQ